MSEDVDPESPPPDDKVLATMVYRLVRSYLRTKAADAARIDLDKFKSNGKIEWTKLPPDFHKFRQKAGESLFLELRSRREAAFIDHFRSTLFAKKQFLPPDEHSALGLALFNETEKVKTLTLMALSANS